MKRERATQLLVEMLRVLVDQSDDPVVALINRVEVFGSYSRGASEPGDVDVNLDYDSAAAYQCSGCTDH